jgi:hypothetical protein
MKEYICLKTKDYSGVGVGNTKKLLALSNIYSVCRALPVVSERIRIDISELIQE